MPDPKFPGHSLKAGEPNAKLVRAIQKRLDAVGCGPIAVDGEWGPATTAAVRLFQARFTARNGTPLKVDGIVGPITWDALFPEAVEAPPKPAKGLAAKALEVAANEVGVREASRVEPRPARRRVPRSGRARRGDGGLRLVRGVRLLGLPGGGDGAGRPEPSSPDGRRARALERLGGPAGARPGDRGRSA